MALQIVVAPRARHDLVKLYDYLEERAGARLAQSYIDRIDTLFDTLSDFPGLGAPRPEFGPSVRSTGIWPYVILYQVVTARCILFASFTAGATSPAKF